MPVSGTLYDSLAPPLFFFRRHFYSLAGCKDFDSFLAALKALGVEVKRGKHLAFKFPGGKRFVRCDSLSEDYTEAAILERIDRKRIVAPKQKESAPNLLIDIQTKLQQAHSPGYERWASVFNLKEMAKTMNFLREHGLLAYPDLESACDAAVQKYHGLSDRTKVNSERMKEISELQKHIGTYGKTREVYAQYRKLPPKKREDFYAEHTSAIISCEVAKLYPDQKKARAEMMELLTVKYNTSRILGLTNEEKQREQRQEER